MEREGEKKRQAKPSHAKPSHDEHNKRNRRGLNEELQVDRTPGEERKGNITFHCCKMFPTTSCVRAVVNGLKEDYLVLMIKRNCESKPVRATSFDNNIDFVQ